MRVHIDRIIETFGLDLPQGPHFIRLLCQFNRMVEDVGYDRFVDEITSESRSEGHQPWWGEVNFNLIPSQTKGPCLPVLVAVSRGNEGKLAFPSIMRQVREHLITCMGTTKLVIIFCDHWQRTTLDEHMGDLRAHHARGVRFVFLLAPVPAKTLLPVVIDFRRVHQQP